MRWLIYFLLSVSLVDAAPGHFQMNHSRFGYYLSMFISPVQLLSLDAPMCSSLQFEATTRMEEQSCRGSMTLRVRGARTGVLLVTIRTGRTTKGAGAWQVLVGRATVGVLRAQVNLRCCTPADGDAYLENTS